jgi:hypothetical protein
MSHSLTRQNPSSSPTPSLLAFQEQAFQHSLEDLVGTLLPLTGTPTAIWRRTGEVVAVGQEFSILSEWSVQDLIYHPSSSDRSPGGGGGGGDGKDEAGWKGKYIWEIMEKRR